MKKTIIGLSLIAAASAAHATNTPGRGLRRRQCAQNQ